jgi:short-subunit dehydrogenase
MVVAITGASAGIGRALAEVLAARGAKLALAARRIERLEELNRSLGTGHLAIASDVSREADCRRFIEQTIARYGQIDTLVCNAGYGFLCPVAQTPREKMEQIFATNVLGTTDCIRFAMPHILRQEPRGGWRGQIMIVSSVVARRGLPFFGAYSATKAAQLSLGESMRIELRPRQIAVTTVHPAGTDTEFGDVSASQSQGKRPRHVPGEPRQSAHTVAIKMVKAIQRPRPEVWPMRPVRWAVSLATLFPSLADTVLGKRSDQIGDLPGEK